MKNVSISLFSLGGCGEIMQRRNDIEKVFLIR